MILALATDRNHSIRPPFNIYGPKGLYDYIAVTMKLCEAKLLPRDADPNKVGYSREGI